MYYFSRAMALIDMNPLIKMKNNKCIQQIKLGVFFIQLSRNENDMYLQLLDISK